MSRSLLVLAFLAALLCGPPRASAQSPDYVIGPRDVLSISVWGEEDLTGKKFTVEADGSFTFPMIGRVKAGGLTLRALEADLRKRLIDGQLYKDPQVTVSVEQFASQKVLVTGEVRQPGPQPLTGDMTLIEALSRAGSTLPTASNEVFITHAPKGKDKDVVPAGMAGAQPGADSVRVDLKELQAGVARDIALRDGDTIYVPKAEMVYVSGQVKNPGAYALQTRDTTVMQAIALAGGLTDRGAANRVKISRVVDGKKVEIKVKDLTDLVLPGDTIIVPERFF